MDFVRGKVSFRDSSDEHPRAAAHSVGIDSTDWKAQYWTLIMTEASQVVVIP